MGRKVMAQDPLAHARDKDLPAIIDRDAARGAGGALASGADRYRDHREQALADRSSVEREWFPAAQAIPIPVI